MRCRLTRDEIMRTKMFVSFPLALALACAADAQPSQRRQATHARDAALVPPSADFEIPKPDGALRPATPPVLTEGYVIGPQDNLSIIVSDEAELTGKYRVDTDGTISMPYLSRVPLAGLSLADAQTKIASLLRAGFIRPRPLEFDHSAAAAGDREVRTPGKVTLPGPRALPSARVAGSRPRPPATKLSSSPADPGRAPNRHVTAAISVSAKPPGITSGRDYSRPVAKRFTFGLREKSRSYVLGHWPTFRSHHLAVACPSAARRRIKVSRVMSGKTVEALWT